MAQESDPSGTPAAEGLTGLRNRMEGWPVWARSLLAFVVAAVVWMAMKAWMPGRDDDSTTEIVVSGIIYAAMLTAVMAFIGRKHTAALQSRTPDERRQIALALRRAELPADVALDPVVRPLSVRTRDQLRANAILGPIVFGFMILLGIGLAIGNQSWIWALYSLGFAAATVVTIVMSGRKQRQLLDLERRIDERTDPPRTAELPA